ncbi:hypothetical protein DFH09DRAFT_879028, partial [Mycena vulgaris]
LVDKSSGYFIYASTIIKFIDDKDFRPTERLQVVMGIKQSEFGAPFAALDQLYTQILSSVHTWPLLTRILTIISVKLSWSASLMDQFLQLQRGDVQLRLRRLHSVLTEPDFYWDRITVHHASFLDFLGDPTRSGVFYIGDVHRTNLACDILRVF